MTRILVIDGHPDPAPERLVAALASAYAEGAASAGHQVRRIDVGALDLPPLRTAAEFYGSDAPSSVGESQAAVSWAQHLAIFHPLWLGAAPATLKGWFEQVFRPGFALPAEAGLFGGLLKGRSARLVVTMGMPAPAYSLLFGAHGVRSLERSVLRLCGISPVRHTLIGGVGRVTPERFRTLAASMRRLGAAGR